LAEAQIVVENREELIFLLSEASELEHMVMLAYLFAALSLKTDAGEGLTKEQLEAVRRWERVISEVAAQEMLQMLVRFFAHTEETEEELQTLSGTAVEAMSLLIKPLGQLLTTLPVGAMYSGNSAGPNFEFYRTSYLLPHRHAA
jgi:Ferritin-like